MRCLLALAFGLALLSAANGQDSKATSAPFTLTWTKGRCIGCKNAASLGEIQLVSRSEVWGIGFKSLLNAVNTVIVHSTDAGRTWREVLQSQQYTDPDGRLAFSFPDATHGWIDPLDVVADEGKMITTRDGGRHWQRVSQQFLQSMQFIDDLRGYGTLTSRFFRTNDGGSSWVETKIPDIGFIECMIFLSPDDGWIAGIHGKDFLVFRTVDGGKHWEESRTTPPQPPELVRDIFFVDPQRGWLVTWNHTTPGAYPGGAYLYLTVDGGKHWTPDTDPSFQGKGRQGNAVRFTSRERGFVFFSEGAQSRLAYTMDGGKRWQNRALPRFVDHCQVFRSDLLCSAGPGFRLLTLHPK